MAGSIFFNWWALGTGTEIWIILGTIAIAYGAGLRFVVWGMMHAAYQIIGRLTCGLQQKAARLLGLEEAPEVKIWIQRTWTFLCVMIAWIRVSG